MLGARAVLDLAAAKLPAEGFLLDVESGAAKHPGLAARRLVTLGPEALAGHAAGAPADALVCVQPTRLGPLIPLLMAFHGALRPGGLAVVSDLVWQTAPTPELVRAFAPPGGRERVRPIEGFEMQVDHAGFDVVERVDLAREAWADDLAAPEARAALAADERGAAKVAAWVLRRRDD